MNLQGWYVIQYNIEHVYLNTLCPLAPPLYIHTYLKVFKNMLKYLCPLEHHYIIFSYGKQLICILKWTQLWWHIWEVPADTLPEPPLTADPHSSTECCPWHQLLLLPTAAASCGHRAGLIPTTRCSDPAEFAWTWNNLPGIKTEKEQKPLGKGKAIKTLGAPQKHAALCPCSFWTSLLCIGFFEGCHRKNCSRHTINEWESSMRSILMHIIHLYCIELFAGRQWTYWKPRREANCVFW